MVLLGVTHEDGPEQVEVVSRKIADLRILDGELSASDVQAPVIVVSQFTLYADTRKGRRPTWNAAAPRAESRSPCRVPWSLRLRARGLEVGTGVFGAHMDVALVNDGPMTILIES